MKKILIAVLLALAGTSAHAQIAKGTHTFHGHVIVERNESKYTVDKQTLKPINYLFIVSPGAGLFIHDNVEFGVNLDLSFSHVSGYSYHDGNPLLSSKSRDYGVGFSPYLQKYWTVTNQLYLTGSASVFASFHHTQNNIPDSPIKDSIGRGYGVGASLSPGLAFFLSNNFSLGASFGLVQFTHSYTKTEVNNYESSFNSVNNLAASLNPGFYYLGIQYYLNR
ncbi:hypothetical protein [Pontibacter chitinilyticus]|uniref:hypothetical protein n=1 Tax=Pontibacter chitinilyticus TaxID=2674989 RepID=UPI003219A522